MKVSIIIMGIFTLISIIGVMINNRIIAKKNQEGQALSSIEIYIKKGLIPNLIAMFNKYLVHEQKILLKITELCSAI